MAYPEVYRYSGKQPKIFHFSQEHEQQVKPRSDRHTSTKELPNTHTKNNQPYISESKCPIYVHQFTPVKISPQYFYNQKPTSPRVRPNNSITKNPKQMLDKLEETYWVSWKPRRDTEINTNFPAKDRISPTIEGHNQMQAYGDIEDTILAYLTERKIKYSDPTMIKSKETKPTKYKSITRKPIKEYSSVFDSVTDACSVSDDKSSDTLINRFEVIYKATDAHITDDIHKPNQRDATIIDKNPSESDKELVVPNEYDVATIYKKDQTEQKSSTLINELSNLDNTSSYSTTQSAVTEIKENEQGNTVFVVNSIQLSAQENLTDQNNEHEEIIEPEETESKILKHTDSLILAKKKHEENENKEHYQQPKCIKLYRKHTVPVTTYSRGGTYPLKSCLRKESSFKGNFRLGAPGSNLFVSVGSFNKRRRY